MAAIPESEIQAYLSSVCAKYQHWQRLYTPTDTIGTQRQQTPTASPFDFGRMVQTVLSKQAEERLPQESAEREKIERLPVLEGIRKYAAEHVLLKGRPGSGKSTALVQLLLEEAQQSQQMIEGLSEKEVHAYSQPRLTKQRETLQADWDLRQEKLKQLRKAWVIESGAAVRFQLQQQIKAEETQLEQLERQLADVEQALLNQAFSPAAQTPAPTRAKIPVLVELRDYCTSVLDLIRDFFKQHGLLLHPDQIETLLFERRLLLLVDGLNELSFETARSDLTAFRKTHAHTPMIITTRDLVLGGDLGIEKTLEMQPLSEAQMQQFVRAYLPEQGEQMLRQLRDRLREFGQTPLLLWMLCEVFQQAPNNQLPSNLAGVFQTFTSMYEMSSVRKHEVALLKGDVRPLSDRRLWKKALKALASVMMQGETPVDFRVVLHRDEAERELNRIFPTERFPVRDILDDLLKYHLLQNRSTDQIEFCHQLLQEYYAAEALLDQLPLLLKDAVGEAKLKRDYLNYLKWTEPLALMLALVEQEARALRVVQLALEVDLNLGAMLAGKAKPELQKKTVDLLLKHRLSQKHPWLPWITHKAKISESAKSKLLGSTRSDKAIYHLWEIMAEDEAMYAEAIDAIGAIGSMEAFQRLFHLIEEQYSDTARIPAIKATLTYGSEEEISRMFELVIKDDILWYFCWEDTIDYIKRHRPKAAIPGLKQCLLSEKLSQGRREDAASSLKVIGTEEAIASLEDCMPKLKKCLLDEERLLSTREGAASLLGVIDTEEAIASLEDCRDKIPKPQSDPLTRSQRMTAFSFLAQRTDPDNDLRSLHESIDKALKVVGSNTSISETRLNRFRKDPLVQLLEIVTEADQSNSQELHDENPLIQKAIDIKLGETSRKKKILFWKQILEMMTGLSLVPDLNSDLFVGTRFKSVSFTAKLEVFLPLVLAHWGLVLRGFTSWKRMFSDSSSLQAMNTRTIESLYESVVKELNKISRNEAIQALRKTICTGGAGLREIAFKELESIDEEGAVETLILKGLNSSRWDVRVWTVKTLRRIADEKDLPQTVLPLLRSLDDKVQQIRTEISLSVGKIASENLLPDLAGLVTDPLGCSALTAIKEIQNHCRFYNYDIAQTAVEEGSGVSVAEFEDMKDPNRSTIINAEVVQFIGENHGHVIGKHPPRSE